jgi:hypothetical protein
MSESAAKLRRALVVPSSQAALDALRDDSTPPAGQYIAWSIPSTTYDGAFQFFNDLARVTGIETDDYAAEEVEPDKLDELIRFVRTYPSHGNRELGELLDRIQGMSYKAQNLKMPFYFVL